MPTASSSSRDRRDESARAAITRRVCGEFFEMPCLRLTARQAQRLFGLSPDVCQRVLASLVQAGTLTRGSDDRYRLNDGRSWPARSRLVTQSSAEHARTG